MRKYAIIPAIVIGGIISFFIGYYLFKISDIKNETSKKILSAEMTNNNEVSAEEYNLIRVNNNEDKISPNTKIIKKIYYIDCGHIKQENETPNEKIMNMNKEEFQAEYIEWEIQKFTNSEVVLYKEVYNYCNEHYIIKEDEGKIVVYKTDKNGKEIEKIQETEIETKYLTENDLKEIQGGIKVYSKKEINKILENFE